MVTLASINMDKVIQGARPLLITASATSPNASSVSSTSTYASTSLQSTTPASTAISSSATTGSKIDLFYSPTTKPLDSNSTNGAQDFAHLAVVCVLVPLAILVFAAVTTAFLLARWARRRREVTEIERRKTLVRENMELRGIRPGEELDKDLGQKRDGVLAKKMYLIEMPRAA
jgi:hypothetical protein